MLLSCMKTFTNIHHRHFIRRSVANVWQHAMSNEHMKGILKGQGLIKIKTFEIVSELFKFITLF